MKTIILFLSIVINSSLAFSSDQFANEIICESLNPDDGFEVVMQSNPTAWVKRVSIVDVSGVTGPQEITFFQIPLQPQIKNDPTLGWVHIYQNTDFSIQLQVDSADPKNYQLLGPAASQFSSKKISHDGLFDCYKKN
ncbi:hypothetical protein [Bdellovibrio sp. HCB337]|uniref:hypothetical protein n=1 Tax=Bdellovibrio sp. HCB337 TaxID=3394358 RepID=UPI0039A65CCF